jgi:alkylhydroperoxidase family enzyme
MARIKESKIGETPFQKLLGHNKDVMYVWTQLGKLLEKDGQLSAYLKEQVRRTLAQSNGCEYCKAKGKPETHYFDDKISIAVGFSEVFLKQKGNMSDATFEILNDYFSEEEIIELCAFISFTSASQYFGAMLDLKPS